MYLNNLLLNNTVINNYNKIPGIRILFKPINILFLNIDDLWLYNYDNIKYNELIKSIFKSISNL